MIPSFWEEAPVCSMGVFLVMQVAYAISFHADHLCDVSHERSFDVALSAWSWGTQAATVS